MGLGDGFARRKENRLKTLDIETIQESSFDYSVINIDKEDEEILIGCEREIRKQQVIYIKSTLDIGKILLEAQERLKKYKTGTFIEWYKNLGFNKDSISYFLRRYQLSLEFPQKKEYISKIPIRLVKELTKKNIEKELVEEAIAEEISNTKQFLEMKNHYSHCANNEIKRNKKVVEKEEIEEILNKYVENKEQRKEIIEMIFKKYRLQKR